MSVDKRAQNLPADSAESSTHGLAVSPGDAQPCRRRIAVFLFCLAALIPLALAQVYSGQAYQTLEIILTSLLVISLIVPFVIIFGHEVWRWLRPN
jgi:hypothetical protein